MCLLFKAGKVLESCLDLGVELHASVVVTKRECTHIIMSSTNRSAKTNLLGTYHTLSGTGIQRKMRNKLASTYRKDLSPKNVREGEEGRQRNVLTENPKEGED
jgi:hypothetical protein